MASQARRVRLLALWSIGVAAAVMGVKFIAWWVTGSVALYSDALESIVNVVASFAAWYAVGVSRKPADATHPFGHHKAEYFSAVLEGVLIAVAALLILHEASTAILEGVQPMESAGIGLAINAGAGAANGLWAWLLLRTGREARSPALIADARHIFSDVITSAGVIAGLLLALATGQAILDPLLAIIVALNILWQGYKLVGESFNGLMDHALGEEDQAAIRNLIAANSGDAIEFHDLKTREAGPARFAEFHLVVDSGMSVARSHEICDRIEDALHEAMPGIRVTIHVEPAHKRKGEPARG